MLNKYVGGTIQASIGPTGSTQTILIISKEKDKAIELITDVRTGEVKSAHEVTLKQPEPKKEPPKVIQFDPLYKPQKKGHKK